MAKSHKIKQVIKSTEKTAVITKAMQVVSASKLPSALDRFKSTKPYADLAQHIMAHYSHASEHPFFQKRSDAKKTGLIILSSDRGLCGSLNLQLFKKALHHLQDQESSQQHVVLSVSGRKGLQFFSKHADILSSVESLSDKPKIQQLMPLITPMLDAYEEKELDRVYIAYNQFENTLTQTPTIRQILPLQEEPNVKKTTTYHHEQEANTILDMLLKNYIESTIYSCVTENIVSEQAARMIAMKNATDNANDIIADLNLTYNKIRQALITQEIAEISAGANQSTGETL
ncbi:ATP synthase F1 subunit gamma [Candidatus Synchoanobacter obligatus]|uniref:ATP synthase gamma chain n=1 Tax=Candidatus Synchoanobacter obligatus TaxID=2919597 RepID=A0ABT1L5J4_9GAMM|nr:ATP synthase F1 subunit gamma [Candidatus Synchoanobacter obligatus]MCP8352186.1 ATP synthase F1 subunit gamma [Candidatus Synchoanobacter obligatus]